MIVVDSNIIAARNLTSVLSAKAERVEQKDPGWIVPVLWRYEFQNILATAIKTRQIKPEQALDVWKRVFGILIENESEPSPAKVIDLVRTGRSSDISVTINEWGVLLTFLISFSWLRLLTSARFTTRIWDVSKTGCQGNE